MSEPNAKKSPDMRDAIAAAGLALLAYGCWLAWKPLGFIVPGALLVWIAIVGARR